jgi:hypothetical protein
MKILKTLAFSFLLLVCCGTVYGQESYDGDLDQKCFNDCCWFFGDIRSKSLTIMSMIDESKSKSKARALSVLLEVELNILIDKLEKRLEFCKFPEAGDNERSLIPNIEEALYLAKQWKRDYCR